MFRVYQKYLERHPLKTKAVTCGVTNGAGELVAQQVIGRGINWRKVLKCFAWGLLVSGPMDHTLYRILERVTKPIKNQGLATVSQLVLANGLIVPFQTLVYLCVIYVITQSEQQQQGVYSLDKVLEFARHKFWSIQVPTWILFPPVQVLTFTKMPKQYWTPFFNVLGFGYNVVVTLTAASSSKPKIEGQDDETKVKPKARHF